MALQEFVLKVFHFSSEYNILFLSFNTSFEPSPSWETFASWVLNWAISVSFFTSSKDISSDSCFNCSWLSSSSKDLGFSHSYPQHILTPSKCRGTWPISLSLLFPIQVEYQFHWTPFLEYNHTSYHTCHPSLWKSWSCVLSWWQEDLFHSF